MNDAKIYRRKNGDYGSSCDGIEDTGHHITIDRNTDLFTVWSVHHEDRTICRDVPRAEAEEAIAADWRAACDAVLTLGRESDR